MRGAILSFDPACLHGATCARNGARSRISSASKARSPSFSRLVIGAIVMVVTLALSLSYWLIREREDRQQRDASLVGTER